MTRWRSWTWTWSPSTPRSPALTSMPPGRGERGPDQGTIEHDEPNEHGDHQSGQSAQALGRSRGGFTTKMHLVVDGRGLPLVVHLTAGNVNDSVVFEEVVEQIRIARPAGGRPRTRPGRVLGDKGYSVQRIRGYLHRRGIGCVIPERADQIANRRRRGRRGGRPPAFDTTLYKRRNLVERCFSKLKQFRAIAARYDKLASRYRSGLLLASLILWLRHHELSDTT
ncbi:IS5 family transposase [Actinomadura rubrisoli]|nr:IS5 family transposase [Actinomadura rubrisoli]